MSSGRPVIGVVGDDAATLTTAIEDAGGTVRAGTADDVLAEGLTAVVTVGEAATHSVARRAPAIPIVPVGAGRGLRSVREADIERAAPSIVAGEWVTESHPILAIEQSGDPVARAVTDVTLVAAEAARISEFEVLAGGDRVGRFRADGVVLATPAGTPGYARRVGTPIVAAETGVAAVAPIAPFATDPDHWIVPHDDLSVTVLRDEAPIDCHADGRTVGTVEYDETVTITPTAEATVAVVPESRPRFP